MSRIIEIYIVVYFLAYAEISSASETNLEKANSKLPTNYYIFMFSNGEIKALERLLGWIKPFSH